MEINVGEYVRTRDGIIKRVNSYNPQENNPLWETLNGSVQMKGTITKHSKDIIDLIEVGDYVNGFRVEMIENGITAFGVDEGRELFRNSFKYNQIETVLTHEQMEANAYTIEKEV
jgi:hypothetical protein